METIDLLRSGQLQGIKRLDLAANLTEFPIEIFDLADSLEILNLSDNNLRSLPENLDRLHQLKVIFLSNNDFEEIPSAVADCPSLSMIGFKSNKIKIVGENRLPLNLRWLILTDNKLERLPNSIGKLQRLQKLMLAGNQLRSLPDKMAACQNLELIRLSANCLESLPNWLFTLPRLSWLAYAGNPCCIANLSPTVTTIPWADLTLSDTLGEGASGVISKGVWESSTQPPTNVAIKIFKGAMTSDGVPADEMNACMAAGEHPHLVGALGKIVDCPNDRLGLMLSLIPPDYRNLGNPPNLDTCTRDTYAAGTSFSVAKLLKIAIGICAAADRLHSQGIMHGDLYAHNILVNRSGHSLLGDFGAASSYDRNDPILGTALERLEVRAFGCLLEDLLDRCQLLDDNPAKLTLNKLCQDCLQSIPAKRPLFREIERVLSAIKVNFQT
ncbi:leucine-rich repeat-containing protein kinase family protein [Chamaesiphon minutus]|uniref:Leucine Rich Repeat (LRR)-containing protein,protein kinase family protein n=1 Tax=Chamaesiphon minutus (strain ATCC 27169 / PCC 6605) TaxID=1173020 RepID=K9UMW5_CHAP6|nr:leucine-rich repeat-containing protein kinase family protein [Chamaesiphon minutus]AFY96442.1 Leucine Rich Repeat (LRR)-containing protein,protein kinase family protein [Chamaesiphon minutus PCC 6605]